MTKEQIEKYREIEDEIQPLKDLMGWCGDKYRTPGVSVYKLFLTKVFKVIPVLYRNKILFSSIDNGDPVFIPKELQAEIVAVIENYIERREKEMEEL